MDGVILLEGTETARSDCSGIVSGVVEIGIGMVGIIIVFLIRFHPHIHRGKVESNWIELIL